jgi:hypothetical protein
MHGPPSEEATPVQAESQRRRRRIFFFLCALGLAAAVLTGELWISKSMKPATQGTNLYTPGVGGQLHFATPDAAMQAVADVCRTYERALLEKVFGAGAAEVLWSGDEDADREDLQRVLTLMEAGVSFVRRSPDLVIAELGKEKWPFPIPLVKTSEGWRFDLEQGADEVLGRRIGANELATIDTMYEYVDAQAEYFAVGRDGNPPAYAQKVRSTPGKKDGLYWPSGDGEPDSPFGDLVAAAAKGASAGSENPQPFQGYYYKILTEQGPNAPGGRKSYVDQKGLMTMGFAAIAWPAEYGKSGITTFIVGAAGVVFQKDLGAETATLAGSVTAYDPDRSWSPVKRPAADEDR